MAPRRHRTDPWAGGARGPAALLVHAPLNPHRHQLLPQHPPSLLPTSTATPTGTLLLTHDTNGVTCLLQQPPEGWHPAYSSPRRQVRAPPQRATARPASLAAKGNEQTRVLTLGLLGKFTHLPASDLSKKAMVQLSWQIHGARMKLGREGAGITWQLLTFSLHLLCQCGRKQTTCEGNEAQ